IPQSLFRVDLIATHFNSGYARERAFRNIKSNNQIFTVDGNALQYFYVRVTITNVAHVIFNGSFVLFEQRKACVATTVPQERNESQRAGFLTPEVGLDIFE